MTYNQKHQNDVHQNMYYMSPLRNQGSSEQVSVLFQILKNSLRNQVFVGSPGSEKAMVPHSSTLAWKIPWMEEPGGLQSMGSLRVGQDSVTSLSLFTFLHWRRQWQPTPVFLPGESQGRGSLVGCHLWGRTELDTTEETQQQQQQQQAHLVSQFSSEFNLWAGLNHTVAPVR